MNASIVKSRYALWIVFPLRQRDGSIHHIPQTQWWDGDPMVPGPQGDSGRLTFARPRVLSVRACRWEVSDQRLISCSTHVGVPHEERFKRTLMLNEIWQEDEELIPGLWRLIRAEMSFQIALLLFIIDCIAFSICARLVQRPLTRWTNWVFIFRHIEFGLLCICWPVATEYEVCRIKCRVYFLALALPCSSLARALAVCILLRALVLGYSASLPVTPARWSGSGTAPRGSRIWLGPLEVCSGDGLERAAPSLLAVAEEDGSCHANCVGEKKQSVGAVSSIRYLLKIVMKEEEIIHL